MAKSEEGGLTVHGVELLEIETVAAPNVLRLPAQVPLVLGEVLLVVELCLSAERVQNPQPAPRKKAGGLNSRESKLSA